jgi:predicted CopG family antitoxin
VAIENLLKLRDELFEAHGSMSTEDIVRLVREGREERDEQIWRSATGAQPT